MNDKLGSERIGIWSIRKFFTAGLVLIKTGHEAKLIGRATYTGC